MAKNQLAPPCWFLVIHSRYLFIITHRVIIKLKKFRMPILYVNFSVYKWIVKPSF